MTALTPVTALEEKVRAAARSTAAQITPDSIRPLDLCRSPRSAPQRRRWSAATLIPLAATAVVTALIAAGLAVAAGAGPASRSPSGTAAWGSSVPRYYVTLTSTEFVPGRASRVPGGTPARRVSGAPVLNATVRATVTGHVLARIAAPRPFTSFRGVTAAADDRTFVLAATQAVTSPEAEKARPLDPVTLAGPAGHAVVAGLRATLARSPDRLAVRFFLLRYQEANPAARLTRLPVGAVTPVSRLQGMALSPDGSRLAVALGGREIKVVSLRTGAARAWITPGPAPPGSWLGGLSWTANGQFVAFNAMRWGRSDGLSVLDTARPPGSLLAASHLVLRSGAAVPLAGGLHCSGQALLAPDALTAACPALRRSRASPRGQLAGFAEFSARTGALLRYLAADAVPAGRTAGTGWARGGVALQVLWVSYSGRRLIARASGPAVLVSSGQVVTLPGSGPPASGLTSTGAMPLAAW